MRIESGKESQDWFSDDCEMFCSFADSTLTDMIERIFSGAISLEEMEAVHHKRSHVEKLCAASSLHAWEYTWDDVKTFMDHRHKECVAFRLYKEILASFCRQLETHNLHVEGQILCVVCAWCLHVSWACLKPISLIGDRRVSHAHAEISMGTLRPLRLMQSCSTCTLSFPQAYQM